MQVALFDLFQAYALKRAQLSQAVTIGDDSLVRVLDHELEPIIEDIVSYTAETREEAHTQLQFINRLLQDEADENVTVIKRSATFAQLVDRYFLPSGASQSWISEGKPKSSGDEFCDQPLFNEAILDSLPDRICVITRDYRYLYCNKANAAYLNRTQLSLIGCHVSNFTGHDSFRALAKPAFDKCFEGESVEYLHYGCVKTPYSITRCRLSPLRGPQGEVIGAVTVLQRVDSFAQMEVR